MEAGIGKQEARVHELDERYEDLLAVRVLLSPLLGDGLLLRESIQRTLHTRQQEPRGARLCRDQHTLHCTRNDNEAASEPWWRTH